MKKGLLCLLLILLNVIKADAVRNYKLIKTFEYNDVVDFDISYDGNLLLFYTKRTAPALNIFSIPANSYLNSIELPNTTKIKCSPNENLAAVLTNTPKDFIYKIFILDTDKLSIKWDKKLKKKLKDVIFQEDGNFIGVISKGVILIDLPTGKIIKHIKKKILSANFRIPDILLYSTKNSIREINLNTFKKSRSIKEDMTVVSSAADREKYIGVIGWKVYYNPLVGLEHSPTSYLIKVYDASFRELMNLKEVNRAANLTFIPNSNFFCYSTSRYIKFYDIDTGEHIFNIPYASDIKSVKISGNGEKLGVSTKDSLDIYELKIAVASTKFDYYVADLANMLINSIEPKELAHKAVAITEIVESNKKEKNEFADFILSIVETSLSKSSKGKKFKLVTRNEIEKILKEHRLGLTGIMDSSKAVEMGKLFSAHFLISGKYWTFGPEKVRILLTIMNVETGEKFSTYKDIKTDQIPPHFSDYLTK